jgi:hypothetical protein
MRYEIKGAMLRDRNSVECGKRLHALHPEMVVKVSVGDLACFYTPSSWACKTSKVARD